MRKIPQRVREKIFAQWLRGDAYVKIARNNGVSLSTVFAVKEKFKEKWPDIEDLRRLSISIKKAKISFYDLVRAVRLIENLNMTGVSLDQLNSYIELMEKMLLGEETDRGKIIESALKLVALEEATEKDYLELVDEFETKSSEVAKLETKKESLEGSIAKLEAQMKKGGKELERVTAEIGRAVATKMRIRNLGLAKLAKLARFINDYEMLGYSTEEVQKLVTLKGILLRRDIDPEKLEEFLKKTGSLNAKISELKRKIGDLNIEYVRLDSRKRALLSRNTPFAILDKILTTRRIDVLCKSCGVILHAPVEDREKYEYLIEEKAFLNVLCPRCGTQSYTPMEIVNHVGWALLP